MRARPKIFPFLIVPPQKRYYKGIKKCLLIGYAPYSRTAIIKFMDGEITSTTIRLVWRKKKSDKKIKTRSLNTILSYIKINDQKNLDDEK